MPTQAETQLAVRVPLDLAERLEAAIESRRISKRLAVIQALEAWLAAN